MDDYDKEFPRWAGSCLAIAEDANDLLDERPVAEADATLFKALVDDRSILTETDTEQGQEAGCPSYLFNSRSSGPALSAIVMDAEHCGDLRTRWNDKLMAHRFLYVTRRTPGRSLACPWLSDDVGGRPW